MTATTHDQQMARFIEQYRSSVEEDANDLNEIERLRAAIEEGQRQIAALEREIEERSAR
ncbi:MAG TPA: hypothetical protein VFA60_01140 [Terriglobales bacterium]|nr:hypothetical protein [Terriglobales bacterium]